MYAKYIEDVLARMAPINETLVINKELDWAAKIKKKNF